jgi:hypothetical protein
MASERAQLADKALEMAKQTICPGPPGCKDDSPVWCGLCQQLAERIMECATVLRSSPATTHITWDADGRRLVNGQVVDVAILGAASTTELLTALDRLYPLPDDDSRAERATLTSAAVTRWMMHAIADIERMIPALMIETAGKRHAGAASTPGPEGK